MYIQYNNVYVVTAARQNCNAASLLLFLHRVIDVSKSFVENVILFIYFQCEKITLQVSSFQVFKHYFEELEEESLRDNFVVVVSYA